MSDNKGIIYESNINKILKKAGVERKSFVPAGSDKNAPDAVLTINNKDYKVEVKVDLNVDFGQGSLDYDLIKKKWILGGGDTPAAMQMKNFLESIKVPELVNRKWGPKGPPRKFTIPLDKFKKSHVDYDYNTFRDQYVDISPKAVSDYYNSKDTYYIQIGDFGFYYMGKDIAKLGVPEFKLRLKLRIRIKRAGSIPIYNYRFATAIRAVNGSLSKSFADLENTDFLQTIKTKSK